MSQQITLNIIKNVWQTAVEIHEQYPENISLNCLRTNLRKLRKDNLIDCKCIKEYNKIKLFYKKKEED